MSRKGLPLRSTFPGSGGWYAGTAGRIQTCSLRATWEHHQRDVGIMQAIVQDESAIAGADSARPSKYLMPNVRRHLFSVGLSKVLVSKSAGFSPPQTFFNMMSPFPTRS